MTNLDSKIAGHIYPVGGAVVNDKGEIASTGDQDHRYVPEAVSFRNYVNDFLFIYLTRIDVLSSGKIII